MADGNENAILSLLQNTNNRVLEMAKDVASIKIEQVNIKEDQKEIKDSIKSISTINTVIQDSLRNKMTPERCLLTHKELKTEIFKSIKDGAVGYAKTGLTIAKVIAYIAAIFGGTALGANQIINLIGGN